MCDDSGHSLWGVSDDGKWSVDAPDIVEIGSDMPISCIIAIENKIWVACADTIYIIPVNKNEFQVSISACLISLWMYYMYMIFSAHELFDFFCLQCTLLKIIFLNL